jgi:hypothetical protein
MAFGGSHDLQKMGLLLTIVTTLRIEKKTEQANE